MPMDRSLYPDNWTEIATGIKQDANWTCQDCGRPCRRPGESNSDLADRLCGSDWWDDFEDRYCVEPWEEPIDGKLSAFTLTVAHLNHIPSDCRPENLKALCSGCHCRYDLADMPLKKRLKRERMGQLTLPVRDGL